MMFPQSAALENAAIYSNIGNNACLAFVSMWIAGIEPDDNDEAIKTVERALKAKVLKTDCSVLWASFFKFLTGRDIEIEFRKIKSLDDLKDVKGRCAVNYVYGSKNHWIGVENCEIKFNSLKSSVCVEKGTPTKARIITFKLEA